MKIRIRILSLALALLMLTAALTSCGENYKLRKSTDKEATPVAELSGYTVNFEMLYTFFLNACEKREGFDESYLEGEGWEARYESLMEEALASISEIYGLLSLCKSVGIDPYSAEMEKAIMDYLKTTVSGGVMGDHAIVGFDSYTEYLDYIREHYHMNDAVNRLMIRYALCEEKLVEYYKTRHRFTEADVRAFFESDTCIRVVWVGRPKNAEFLGLSEKANLNLLEKGRELLQRGDIKGAIQYSLEPVADFYMGPYTLDSNHYAKLIEAAYRLGEGDVSSRLDLGVEGYYYVKRLEKSPLHFDLRYEEIEGVYLYEVQSTAVLREAEKLLQGIVYKDAFHTLTPADFLAD